MSKKGYHKAFLKIMKSRYPVIWLHFKAFIVSTEYMEYPFTLCPVSTNVNIIYNVNKIYETKKIKIRTSLLSKLPTIFRCHCLPHTNAPSLFQNWNYGILFTFKEVFSFHLLKKPLKNLGIVTTNDGYMLNSI